MVVNLQILQPLLVVDISPSFYKVSTVLFQKYGGANFSVTHCMSHFSMFNPTKAAVKMSNGNMGHSQGIGVFYVVLLTFLLYVQWGQFIIFQVTLPTLYHWVPSNFMLVFIRLHLIILNIVNLLALKIVIGDHPTRLKTI